MELLGAICIGVGFLTYFIAHILFVVAAFRMSTGAGIVALFLGCFFYVAMVVMNPQASWKPLMVGITGVLLVMIGAVICDGLHFNL